MTFEWFFRRNGILVFNYSTFDFEQDQLSGSRELFPVIDPVHHYVHASIHTHESWMEWNVPAK